LDKFYRIFSYCKAGGGVAVRKGLLVAALLLLGLAGWLVIRTLRPGLFDSSLRREYAVTGLVVGSATRSDMVARYGHPGRERREAATTLYEYPALGLLFRMDNATGLLIWYEVTAPEFPTARGVRVGAPLGEISAAYGSGGAMVRFPGRARLRYAYGVAYALEFWLNDRDRLERIVFYRA